VVREDGSLGGWRWGVERKRDLLARERSHVRALPPRRSGTG
jgi:AraC family transcriptional regulator of adaptative response/methylated-DNA-[protein]-cysteine methyltransferase